MKKFTFLFVFAFIASLVLSSNAFGQISFRGASTATGTITSISVNMPSGVVQNDVMIAVIAKQGNTSDATGPAGWTLIDGADLNGTTDRNASVFYKVAGASEAGPYSFSLGIGTNHVAATIVAFYNVDVSGANPFDVAPGTLFVGQSATVNATAITTTNANAAVVMCGGIAGSNRSWSAWGATSPASLAEIADIGEGNTSDGASAGAAWALKSSAGSTGTGVATLSSIERYGAILIALKPITGPPPPTVNAGPDQLVGGTSVTLTGSTSAGSPTYAWTKTSGPAGQTITSPSSAVTTVTGLVPGTYVFRLTVNGSTFDEVTVRVITGTNLWATASEGTQIASFSVSAGTVNSGPTNMFAASFTGATNTYTRTAALGRNNIPSLTAGYFYYLGTSSGGNNNDGLVEVWGASATGTIAKIGQLDFNGGSGSELGFVRLGMGPDGTGWILAGDGTTIYLASFASNGLNAATPVVVDASVTLVGGSVGTFVNGDLCLDGNGNLIVLANNGSGTTEIYTGQPTANTTLTKKWDVNDNNGNAFTGQVNGVALDILGGLYVSTNTGLFYINQATANSNAATVNCALSLTVSGLQDLASNVFPNTIITPVKISDFTVIRQGSNAMLNWTTVTETNSDHFEIERSYDGINFTVVGSKLAAGNSSDVVNYQYADPISVNSGNIYYRLKSLDKDARSAYSKIVVLRLNAGIVKDFSVYPNPFSSDLKIQISSEKESAATIRISNAVGQLVVSRNVTIQKGENILVLSSELQTLKPGMHLMEIIMEDGKVSQKIIKR